MPENKPRVIAVPKTPRRAFNKKRRPSQLILNQIAHLEWAARPASRRKPGQLHAKKVTSEGEAAERIAYLTGLVQEAQLLPMRGAPADDQPYPEPKSNVKTARRKVKKSKSAKARKTASRRSR